MSKDEHGYIHERLSMLASKQRIVTNAEIEQRVEQYVADLPGSLFDAGFIVSSDVIERCRTIYQDGLKDGLEWQQVHISNGLPPLNVEQLNQSKEAFERAIAEINRLLGE